MNQNSIVRSATSARAFRFDLELCLGQWVRGDYALCPALTAQVASSSSDISKLRAVAGRQTPGSRVQSDPVHEGIRRGVEVGEETSASVT